MTALYRTYRPQSFDDVVGQEAVVRTLRNAIDQDHVRQAYLFAGPRGTGKTSMARILAKALNCLGASGPTSSPDATCHSCVAIANGTSLDVVEMDAASQRGIDDIREIRERVVLQPVEGRYKVYILDEAHQLTGAAWNALLKLIEEPPPHLLFIFCTTDLSQVIPTVRSRCQTFVFQRPRLAELVTLLRRVADGEGLEVPDAALSLIARSARGSFRDAVSTLDQLAAATNGAIDAQAVLQLLGAVDEESLLRLCDMVVDQDTAGALVFIEELAEQGQDLGRLVDGPPRAPSPPAPRAAHGPGPRLAAGDRGDEGAPPPAGESTARADGAAAHRPPGRRGRRHASGWRPASSARARHRQGRRGRTPICRASRSRTGSSSSRPGSTDGAPPRRNRPAQPIERASAEASEPGPPPPRAEEPQAPDVELEQVVDAWQRTIVEAVRERSIPVASLLSEARPTDLEGDTLTLEFPAGADFHRRQVAEPGNIGVLRDALFEVTGRKLVVVLETGEAGSGAEIDAEPQSEDDWISTLKDTFDAEGSGGAHRMKFDMNKMLQEAQRMQAELAKAQEEAATEVVEASAGGGMVTVKANGAGEVVEIRIDPRAVDPDDPELLADMVLAAVNEALRSARSLMESKMSGIVPGDLGGLGGLLPGS